MLEVAAGLEAAERVLIELFPIADAANHVPGADEVEGVAAPGPVLVCVVEFEGNIWRDPGRLDGCDIGAGDLGVGELIREVAFETDELLVESGRNKNIACVGRYVRRGWPRAANGQCQKKKNERER